MSDLAAKTCVPCRGGVPALSPAEYEPLLAELTGWSVVDDHHLTKTYDFDGFVEPLAFVNRVGAIAEQEVWPRSSARCGGGELYRNRVGDREWRASKPCGG